MAIAQLPSYRDSADLSTYDGGSRYRNMFRGLVGRARGAGGRYLADVRSGVSRFRSGDQDYSVGGVAASLSGTAGAAVTLGTIDGSPVGTWLADKTGGIVTPSRIVGAIAIGARATGADLKYSRSWSRVNNATMRAMVPVWMYGAGLRVWPAAVKRFGGDSSPPQVQGLSGVETKEKPAQEPIPGEATAT